MGDVIKMIADLLCVSEAEVEWVYFRDMDLQKLELAEEAVNWYLGPKFSFKRLRQLARDLPVTTPGFYVIVHKAFEAIVLAKTAEAQKVQEEEIRRVG